MMDGGRRKWTNKVTKRKMTSKDEVDCVLMKLCANGGEEGGFAGESPTRPVHTGSLVSIMDFPSKKNIIFI